MEWLRRLAAQGWEVRDNHFGPVINFAYPVNTKPVSVTGGDCELNCAHCGGHYLKHMKPLAAVSANGGELGPSCLISGGCNAAGLVPLAASLDRLTALKQGRRYNLHAGLAGKREAAALAPIADVVSFDFVGADATISEVFGTTRTVADYVDSYQALRAECKVVPHICIGLHGGEIRGEYRALAILEQLGADGLTFIIFTPTKGTRFAGRKPPGAVEAVKLMAEARLKFPTIPLNLGCMRPGGRYRAEIDQWAVRLGINTIVNPAPAAVDLAGELGLQASRKEECCAL